MAGRRRATGELPLPLAVLHRGSPLWRGRAAPGWRQGRRGADRAPGWRGTEELTMSQADTPHLATPPAGTVAPEAVVLRAQPRRVPPLHPPTLAHLLRSTSVDLSRPTTQSSPPHRPT